MSAAGAWNIVIKSPIGDQKSLVTLEESGGVVTGTMSGSAGEAEVEDGKVDGDVVSWTSKVTKPMPVTLEFTGKIDGDAISGNVKLGMFGNAAFSGERA